MWPGSKRCCVSVVARLNRRRMTTPISRRDFLRSLVPSWATRRNLVAGAIGAGVLVAVSVAFSVLRNVGFVGVLKLLAVGGGLLCFLWLFGWLRSFLQRTFKQSPPVAQSLVVVLLQFAGFIAMCLLGSYVLARWEATADKTEFIIPTSFVLVVAFIDEWRKRRAKPTPEVTPAEFLPSNPGRYPNDAA